MHKTEKYSLGPVFPLDNSAEEEISTIKQHLQNAGFSETDSDWLVDVFKRPDCFGGTTDESVFRDEFGPFESDLEDGLNTLKERVPVEKDSQTLLMLLFSLMLNFGPGYDRRLLPNVELKESEDGSSDIPQWVREFQKQAKFNAESLDLEKLIEIYKGSYNTSFQLDDLLPFLFPNGVPLNQIVDLDLLSPVRRRSISSNDFYDPKQLEFWLKWRFSDNTEFSDNTDRKNNIVKLDTLLHDFSAFSEDVLGDKIFGLFNAIDNAMCSAPPGRSERLNPVGDGWRVVAHELIPFLELLNTRKPELSQERSTLLKAWWHLSYVIYGWAMGDLESELSDDLKDKLIESASRHIGILRSVLRDRPENFEDENVYDFYDKAFYVLLSFAPPWKRLKPLLLAFTEMTEQAVAKDLRTWREHDSTDNPPHPYSRVPNWIEVAMYPQNLRTELAKDPYLQDLREEFAKFCLGRLRTKEKNKKVAYTDKDFVEPRPAWRWCYVQALAALRVNPGGRGHKTLFWLLNNDPDKTVKELAKKAHKKVRHLDRGKPNLDEGASPRRPLFEAFWWLRQAHLITLDIEVDPAGAMRTRRKELHRTREKDDRFK